MKKTHYNKLRAHYLLNPTLQVEGWEVRDYRQATAEALFADLGSLGVFMDTDVFHSYSEMCETPEELTTALTEELPEDPELHDQVFLLTFELWRRLLPERRSLSLFCDELDHCIQKYEQGNSKDLESIQDTLASLEQIIEENIDEGDEPQTVFEAICQMCSEDLESFLYDYIADQIENENLVYASELIEDFEECISEVIWFDLLRARVLFHTDPEEATHLLNEIVSELEGQQDLEFNLELLSFLLQEASEETFAKVVRLSLPILETEKDFQELLLLCIDFYHFIDKEEKEAKMQSIYDGRGTSSSTELFPEDDPDLETVLVILK